jgi:hypothetical protein
MMAPNYVRQIFDLKLKQWFLPFSITDSINDSKSKNEIGDMVASTLMVVGVNLFSFFNWNI